MEKNKNNSYFKNFKNTELLCSFVCSCLKIVIVQPFDMIRFRIQSSEKSSKLKLSKFLKETFSLEGYRVLLKAFNVTSLIIFCNTGFQFTFFQRIHSVLKESFIIKYNIISNNNSSNNMVDKNSDNNNNNNNKISLNILDLIKNNI